MCYKYSDGEWVNVPRGERKRSRIKTTALAKKNTGLLIDVGFEPMEDEDAEDPHNEAEVEPAVKAGHDVDERRTMKTMRSSRTNPWARMKSHHLVDDMEEDSECGSENMEEDPEIPHGFVEHVSAKENLDQTSDAESQKDKRMHSLLNSMK
ncbi:hypothetical protein Syun_014435 [Stephania yunnanensis]|uniref:Uncharacterized protein n=1 Tax=Stephania yunnanensis TaxID=152371 RepID=A0AAP0JLG5_9MAGN